MSERHRVAIIGCGDRGGAHSVGLKLEKRAEVVALADIKPEAAVNLNEKFGFGATIYTDYHEMLRQEHPEIVVVALWTGMHLSVVRDCAEQGVRAILSEKPMAPTWGEAQEYARIVERTGCQLTFGHQRRFARGNQLARKLIAEGRFGQIQRVDLYSPPASAGLRTPYA